MLSRIRAPLIALVALSLLTTSVSSAAEPSLSGDKLREALAFRSQLGFDTSPERIAAVEVDPASVRPLGIAMTPAEAAEMDRRAAIWERIGEVAEYAADVTGYAGIYFDQLSGGQIVVLTSGLSGPMADIVGGALSAGDFRVEEVANSLTDLQATFDVVSRDLELLIAQGFPVSSVDLDEVRNLVRIGVSALTPALSKALTERYGELVLVAPEPAFHVTHCVSRLHCAEPDKGGLKIIANGVPCTSGFLGRPVGSSTPLYVLTAGHCIQVAGGLSKIWKHDGVTLGDGAIEDFYNGSNADSGAIDDVETAGKNFVYAGSSSDIRAITGKYSNATQAQGVVVCRSGVTSGYDCGTIAATNQSIPYDQFGYTIHHMWTTSFPSDLGDSGGSVLYASKALGIQSATNGVNSAYSTIDWIESESAIRPCYTSACG